MRSNWVERQVSRRETHSKFVILRKREKFSFILSFSFSIKLQSIKNSLKFVLSSAKIMFFLYGKCVRWKSIKRSDEKMITKRVDFHSWKFTISVYLWITRFIGKIRRNFVFETLSIYSQLRMPLTLSQVLSFLRRLRALCNARLFADAIVFWYVNTQVNDFKVNLRKM